MIQEPGLAAKTVFLQKSMRDRLKKQLEPLHSLIPVAFAKVVLEQRRDFTPAFCAQVHLAVPGPDIHVAARDHTLEAVWLKVTNNLRKQIKQHKARNQLRLKSQRQNPLPASRWSSAPADARA